MNAPKAKYGDKVLLQFEEFGNSTTFNLLANTRTHIARSTTTSRTFLFLGAGTSITDLIAQAIAQETGKSVEESRKQIWLVDSRGLIVESRNESLQHHKLLFAHDTPACPDLLSAIDQIKPTALIGVCTIAKAFSEEVCQKMCVINKRPIIFALSNPTSKAECTAEEAYTFTDGKCIIAGSSPFDPVVYSGKRFVSIFVPINFNNAHIFVNMNLRSGFAHQ
ncbi:NADP-dependent malic enzyme [Phytophthora cinnamomi]|uniref:NADP-dependent malic enzyme n=1 Tax=Phytophthora cinnamomi TaxID=4785 RepID=UPI0035598A19|nr:NADP-dependent malic enzyme [Phytophthora cinnamomi]